MGVSWELFRTFGSTKEGVQFFGTLLGLVCLQKKVKFFLPKINSGASWGCFWFVLGAPEGLLRLVLGAPEGLLRLVLGAPEGLLRVEICLTEVSS